MNKNIKEKWVKALRSGKYTQAKQALKIDNSFCCLGVLCDIYGKEKRIEWGKEVENPYREEVLCFPFLNSDSNLPEEVKNWAELESKNPNIEEVSLGQMNDGGMSFLEIADSIEKNL